MVLTKKTALNDQGKNILPSFLLHSQYITQGLPEQHCDFNMLSEIRPKKSKHQVSSSSQLQEMYLVLAY